MMVIMKFAYVVSVGILKNGNNKVKTEQPLSFLYAMDQED